MLPALQAASESGANKVVVITDGAIEDSHEVQRWLPRLGLEVDVQTVTTNMPSDRALVEVSAPQWAEAGKPIEVRVGVTGNTESTGPMRVTVRADGSELGNATLAAAQPGRISTGTVTVTPSATTTGRLVRLDVGLEGTDAVAANDKRSVYVYVGAKPTGVALVSLEPDWEPRFLQPVLEQSIGLPVRSFFRTGPNVFVTGGVGRDIGQRVSEEELKKAVREADLVVLHGVGTNVPDWVEEAWRTRPRILLLPREAGASLVGLDVPAAMPGDWFVATDVPPSPIAPLIAGLPIQNLPPLSGLHLPRDLPAGAWAPLQATRGRRGAPAPIAYAQADGSRRRVVALAQGYWRWSFRGGEGRTVYSRLWGALAGWLVQEQTQVAGGAVRPAQRVVERAQRITWVAPGLSADSLHVRLLQDGTVAAETAIPMQPGDSAFSPAPAPGNYRYEARAFAAGREVGTGSGPLTVEVFSTELVRPARPLDELKQASAQAVLDGLGRAGARPLRTSFWPYLVITLLLATEWVLRRRWGLR